MPAHPLINKPFVSNNALLRQPRAVRSAPRRAVVRAELPQIPVATDSPFQITRSKSKIVRKYLNSIGWDTQWVDGIIMDMNKGVISTDVATTTAAVEYLKSLGIDNHKLENMVFLCKGILGQSVDHLKAVVSFLESKNITGINLIKLLETQPKVLTFTPSGDELLSPNGTTKAAITTEERQNTKYYGVLYYRNGASFEMSPVSPKKHTS